MPHAAEHIGHRVLLQQPVRLCHDLKGYEWVLVAGNANILRAVADVVTVGWIGHNEIDAVIRQAPEDAQRITADDLVERKG